MPFFPTREVKTWLTETLAALRSGALEVNLRPVEIEAPDSLEDFLAHKQVGCVLTSDQGVQTRCQLFWMEEQQYRKWLKPTLTVAAVVRYADGPQFVPFILIYRVENGKLLAQQVAVTHTEKV